jgi:hypothetical protein
VPLSLNANCQKHDGPGGTVDNSPPVDWRDRAVHGICVPEGRPDMRLDADLLRRFRQQRGYQTRINAILRAYMQAHESE